MSAVQDQATVAEDTRGGKDRSPFYKEAAKCPSPVEGKKILEEVEAGQITPRCLIYCSQGGSDFASVKLPAAYLCLPRTLVTPRVTAVYGRVSCF